MDKKGIPAFVFIVLLLFLAEPLSSDFFSPAKNLSNDDDRFSFAKDIDVIPGTGNVFVIWADLNLELERERVIFCKSTDGGASWSPKVRLNCADPWWWEHSPYWEVGGAAMAVDDPYIHIVMSFRKDWLDDFEVFYRRSVDLGETWEPWIRLTNNSTPSWFPDVAAAGGYVHVVYVDDWPGNNEIMYQRITGNGAGPVDQIRRLTYSSGNSGYPALAVSKNGLVVNVVYEDDTSGTTQIFYKRITDSGTGALETRRLTFGSNNKYGPSVVTSSGEDDQYVFLAYTEDWQGNDEIMYKRLDQYGAAGGTVITARLTYSLTASNSPAVAFDGSTNAAYVIYEDTLSDNTDIFYKKLDTFGGAGFTTGRVSYGAGYSYRPRVAAGGGWAYVIWQEDSGILGGIPEIFFKRGN